MPVPSIISLRVLVACSLRCPCKMQGVAWWSETTLHSRKRASCFLTGMSPSSRQNSMVTRVSNDEVSVQVSLNIKSGSLVW